MMKPEDRVAEIKRRINQALSPAKLEVIDESHLHAGHAGAQSGKGHFRVVIKSDALANVRMVKAHQMIYQSLGELMQTEIHALAIKLEN